jgi:hypothetical protein
VELAVRPETDAAEVGLRTVLRGEEADGFLQLLERSKISSDSRRGQSWRIPSLRPRRTLLVSRATFSRCSQRPRRFRGTQAAYHSPRSPSIIAWHPLTRSSSERKQEHANLNVGVFGWRFFT